MQKKFWQYHKFTKEELIQIGASCIFVFDTNTLLNMYRYSRNTVEAYIKVLEDLKLKNQLWIPYQVGYEFHENRIEVISEYEKSYDEILTMIGRVQNDIQVKYKNHPFLDSEKIINDIKEGLSTVTTSIEEKKKSHPKWIETDEVLERLNKIFEGNVGNNFDEDRLNKIKEEGKERYEKRIPPGFKDNQKTEDKKYGDLILWHQIIDKAKETRKSIILISGDTKEDWWLQKDGKRIMPLPQLKKEMLDKAGVDFHIYTADKFLELYSPKQHLDETILEVRKIIEMREREEEQLKRRMEPEFLEADFDPRINDRLYIEYLSTYQALQEVLLSLTKGDPNYGEQSEKLEYLGQKMAELYSRGRHGKIDDRTVQRFYDYGKELCFNLEKIIQSGNINPQINAKLVECLGRIDRANYIFKKYR